MGGTGNIGVLIYYYKSLTLFNFLYYLHVIFISLKFNIEANIISLYVMHSIEIKNIFSFHLNAHYILGTESKIFYFVFYWNMIAN